MNSFRHLGIGLRLGLGFGALLALMVLAIGLSILRFGQVGQTMHRIVDEDWVKAQAASTIDATARANARHTMELLLVTDPDRAATVHGHIQNNKLRIDEALATLDRLVHRPAGKAMLAALKTDRAAYVASFSKVAQLVESG